MAPSRKTAAFHREGNDWFCRSSLPSDITLVVDCINFHLHKFPLISRCGRIAKTIEESQDTHDGTSVTSLEEFPGGSDTFFLIVKFCYGGRIELTARNVVVLYCAADYLEMTDDYGEDNLVSRAEVFFYDNVLKNWKGCILALQSCESIITRADKLQIISRCLTSISVMICTDPGSFGWPMLMYGSLQSPGGSILWNGINTGARIHSSIDSDWWFEDISYLGVHLFVRLIYTMEARGIKPENLAGAIMYYCRKYLPGLDRWQAGQSGKTRTVASFSMTPAAVDQKVLLESVIKLLPQKEGKSFCRFLLGLLRVALILGVNHTCQETLERKIGKQLDLATLDALLILNYEDSDTLYNTDCVEQMIHYFISSESRAGSSSCDLETLRSSAPLKRVAKLIDNYIAEVASDVNLKPDKMRSLAEALPDSSRSLHDGLYRALDIYLKAHPWLSDKDKQQLCNIIDFQKLSIDACAHASQNKRLSLRIVLQVLFFEQLQLRTALAGCLHIFDTENAPAASVTGPSDMAGQIVQRDGWMTVVRENQVLKMDLERMRSRVGELEEEYNKMKQEMKRVTKSHSYISSPRFIAKRLGCKLLPQSSDAQTDVVESSGHTPRSSREQVRLSHHSRHRKSFLLF